MRSFIKTLKKREDATIQSFLIGADVVLRRDGVSVRHVTFIGTSKIVIESIIVIRLELVRPVGLNSSPGK